MGDEGAIADVGKTLVELLRTRMDDSLTDDQIVLASPVDDDLKPKVRLTLFLFAVDRSAHHSNVEHRLPSDGPQTREPLSLDLKYLLTAHEGKGNGGTSTTVKSMDVHTVLGRAMQVFQDNAIVQGPDLYGSLATDDEPLQLSILPETTNTVVNLWNTFQGEPYRPSVTYLATPVDIESRHEEPVERVEHVRVDESIRTGDGDA